MSELQNDTAECPVCGTAVTDYEVARPVEPVVFEAWLTRVRDRQRQALLVLDPCRHRLINWEITAPLGDGGSPGRPWPLSKIEGQEYKGYVNL